MQCYVNRGMQVRIHTGLHTLAHTFSTETAKHTICFNMQKRALTEQLRATQDSHN